MDLINTVEDLNKKILQLGLQIDTERIKRAFEYSNKAHQGQKRKSGEPFISHPLSVASLLVDLHMDEDSIIAGFLHDVVEDTDCTLEEIETEFGSQVSLLVDGLTKLARIEFKNLHEKQSENIRKMIIAMSKDVRVILIKLADRLHNIKTLNYLPKEKQVYIAKETLEIYAPLASRLGMQALKTDLENFSFQYSDPEIHSTLKKKMKETHTDREEYMHATIKEIDRILKKSTRTKYEIHGRCKNFYSIYRKMKMQNLSFEQIHDVVGFRICVNKTHECYETLGIVHSAFKPAPGRFKDFIATPKKNNYQSLHTTVIGPQGKQIEIQIRTFDMHFLAERGIAAHWIYKTQSSVKSKNLEKNLEKFNLLKDLTMLHQQSADSQELLENIKLDLFESDIYVFTPRGDIKELPFDSSPVDFAYSIHTSIGNKVSGAQVNGRQVPLKHKLQSGDIVEVITSKNQKPNKDWLNFCVTSKARTRIKSFVKEEERKEALEIGKKFFEKGLNHYKVSAKDIKSSSRYAEFMKNQGFNSEEELLITLGFGKFTFKDLLDYIKKQAPDVKKTPSLKTNLSSQPLISVEGDSSIMVNFAKCCLPVYGDSIRGYISFKKGIVIHRSECFMLGACSAERFVNVEWKSSEKQTSHYTTNIEVICVDNPGTLNRLSEAFIFFGLNIFDLKIKNRQDGKAHISFSTKVKNIKQTQNLIKRLSQLNDVISVSRTSSDPRG